MKLVVSPQAATDIEVATRWWNANRPSAPGLLEQELLEALEFIATTPHAGAPLRGEHLSEIRRLPLSRTRYVLYYRLLNEKQEVACCVYGTRAAGQRRSSEAFFPFSFRSQRSGMADRLGEGGVVARGTARGAKAVAAGPAAPLD